MLHYIRNRLLKNNKTPKVHFLSKTLIETKEALEELKIKALEKTLPTLFGEVQSLDGFVKKSGHKIRAQLTFPG